MFDSKKRDVLNLKYQFHKHGADIESLSMRPVGHFHSSDAIDVVYSYRGMQVSDRLFMKNSVDIKSEVSGYKRNPGLSAPLVFYDNETSCIVTAEVGEPVYKSLRRKFDLGLVKSLASSIRKLKAGHGDMNLMNCISVEKEYNGPSITLPSKGAKVVFIDYGHPSDLRPKECDLFAALIRIARDVEPSHKTLIEAYGAALSGFGISAKVLLADMESSDSYGDSIRKSRTENGWATQAGMRETVSALEELSKR